MGGANSATVLLPRTLCLALLALYVLSSLAVLAASAAADPDHDVHAQLQHDAAAISTLDRDAEIDAASVAELLAHPLRIAPSLIDEQLQRACTQCRELNTLLASAALLEPSDNSHELQSNAVARAHDDVVYCRKTRYVRHRREQMRATLRTEHTRVQQELEREQIEQLQRDATLDEHTLSEQDGRSAPSVPQDIETRSAASLDLQAFFETFAEPSRPVVLTPGADDSGSNSASDSRHSVLGFDTDDQLLAFRDKCFGRETESPLQLHDAACTSLLERFHVPLVLVHDYIRRTNVSLAAPYLPSLVSIPLRSSASTRASVATTLVCPHGLHMLVVALPEAASAPASPLQVDVSVYDQRVRPFLQQHTSALEEVALSATTGDVIDRQQRHASPDGIRLTDALPPIPPLYCTQVPLTRGTALFVPGSLFARIEAADGDDEGARSTAPLLRFCFVDASNFNAVKTDVAVDALVDADAQTLARALASHAFDRTMFRRPSPQDARWSNFVAWPKETKLVKKSDLVDANGDQVVLSRRERLKQWQDDKRWDRHVASLTLPVPLPPVVLNATRTTATLRFQDVYEPPKHDITAYGYIVRWRTVDDASSTAFVHEMNLTRSQLARSALPTALFGDDFDGKDIEAVVEGLAAETRYTFSVQIYVDDTAGLESESSRVVLTHPCGAPSRVRGVPTVVAPSSTDAACTTLQWLDPADDGGKPIGLYLINARMVQESDDDMVAALAGVHDALVTAVDEKVFTLDAQYAQSAGKSWKTAAVCTLVPGATYVFRVAAMNAIGAGPWSVVSEPVVLPSSRTDRVARARRLATSSAQVPTLKGRGDPAYVPMRAFAVRELADLVAAHGPEVVIATLSEAAIEQDAGQRPRIVLSDVHERVVIETEALTPSADTSARTVEPSSSESTSTFDVWASHFSPRAFHVSSELVLADPLDASTPLRNAAVVKDRVVIVARGAVPFVFKAHYAQEAGALGVIIADVNDTCRGQFDQQCVPGADKNRGEGFAAQDQHALWEQNRIPCVLALQDASQRLLELAAATS